MTFTEQAVPILYPVLLTLITALIGWATQAVVARMKAGAARDAMDEAGMVAKAAVADVAQRLYPLAMKTASGKLTPEAAADLKQEAMAIAKDSLSNHAIDLLKSNAGRIEKVLGPAIESAVTEQKVTPAAVELTAGEPKS